VKIRNNRIGTTGLLNQHCVLAPDLESILLARMRKILLQQYLPVTDGLGDPGRRGHFTPPCDQIRNGTWSRQLPKLVANRTLTEGRQ
jgi:hypothetical protein